MTYSCSDFADDVYESCRNHKLFKEPRSGIDDNPSLQADLVLNGIERLIEERNALRKAVTEYVKLRKRRWPHRPAEIPLQLDRMMKDALKLGACTPPKARPALICVTLEGGLVQDVCADRPISARVLVIDYDTEGADQGELVEIPQDDGTVAKALASFEEPYQADLADKAKAVDKFLKGKD